MHNKIIWEIILGKLVRDKIPQIIMEDGKKPIIRTLSQEEYLKELDIKLNEEVAEYQADKSIEEMADVLSVPQVICVILIVVGIAGLKILAKE